MNITQYFAVAFVNIILLLLPGIWLWNRNPNGRFLRATAKTLGGGLIIFWLGSVAYGAQRLAPSTNPIDAFAPFIPIIVVWAIIESLGPRSLARKLTPFAETVSVKEVSNPNDESEGGKRQSASITPPSNHRKRSFPWAISFLVSGSLAVVGIIVGQINATTRQDQLIIYGAALIGVLAAIAFFFLFCAWLWTRSNGYYERRPWLAWLIRLVILIWCLNALRHLSEFSAEVAYYFSLVSPPATGIQTALNPPMAPGAIVPIASSTASIPSTLTPAPTQPATDALRGIQIIMTQESQRTMYVCVPMANIRSGPGTDYPVRMQSQQGDSWNVLGKYGDWFEVRQPQSSLQLFMHQSVLCDQPRVASSLPLETPSLAPLDLFGGGGTPIASREMRVCVSSAAVRSTPGLDYGPSGFLPKDATWVASSMFSGWYYGTTSLSIDKDSLRGYVYGGDLCDPDPSGSVACDDYIYNRWKNGKSDKYAPPCVPTPTKLQIEFERQMETLVPKH